MTALQREQNNGSNNRGNNQQLRLSGAGSLPGRTALGQHRDETASGRLDESDGSAIDSHAFANSNSSSEAENDAAMMSSTPLSYNNARGVLMGSYGHDFDQRKQSYMKPRLEPVRQEKESEIQKMLERKKGFDVIESEELFQLLYNPHYPE